MRLSWLRRTLRKTKYYLEVAEGVVTIVDQSTQEELLLHKQYADRYGKDFRLEAYSNQDDNPILIFILSKQN